MKPKLKQYLKVTAIFGAGLVVGLVIMGYLSARASKTFVEVLRSNYHAQEMTMAAQAHREGNKYAEFIHRNNVVNTSPFGEPKVFKDMKTAWTFSFPLAAPILDRIISSPANRGRRRTYGIEVGQLAEATENIGLKEEATKLWEESGQLTEIKDMTKLHALIAGLHKIDDDSTTKSQRK